MPFIFKYLKELSYTLNEVVQRQCFLENGNTATAGVEGKQNAGAAHTLQCCPTNYKRKTTILQTYKMFGCSYELIWGVLRSQGQTSTFGKTKALPSATAHQSSGLFRITSEVEVMERWKAWKSLCSLPQYMCWASQDIYWQDRRLGWHM